MMRQRCWNQNDEHFANYGGRGITICARWMDFSNFYADMGNRPGDKTIDRIDVNGDYEPGNCRWATPSQQNRNRRNNRILKLDGEERTLTGWAEHIGMNRSTLDNRIRDGWSTRRALTVPVLRMHLGHGEARRHAEERELTR